MPVLASLVAAIVPMILYMIFLWQLDKYEKEPFGQVLRHFFWGASGAVILAILGTKLFTNTIDFVIPSVVAFGLFETIIAAPFVEEITKGMYLIRTSKSNNFDNITDGLVYGGAIGLGFGMTENFLYFFTYGVDFQSWISIVIIRSIFSAVMHCISTATLGAFFGMYKFSVSNFKYLLPVAGYAIAVLIHFMWNLSVSYEGTFLWGLLFLLLLIIVFLIVFTLSVANDKKIITKELTDEEDISLILPDHIEILATLKRNRKGWIKEEFRKVYVANAVKYAFRKHQFKHSEGNAKEFYQQEIDKLKIILTEIVNKIRIDITGEIE